MPTSAISGRVASAPLSSKEASNQRARSIGCIPLTTPPTIVPHSPAYVQTNHDDPGRYQTSAIAGHDSCFLKSTKVRRIYRLKTALVGIITLVVSITAYQTTFSSIHRVKGQSTDKLQTIRSMVFTHQPPPVNILASTSISLGLPNKTDGISEFCDHSCIQVHSNAIIGHEGNIVGHCQPKNVQRRTAMVLTMLGHVNPHHAVHEDYFPLAYQVRNCLVPDTDVFCQGCHNMDLLAGIFGEALKEWVQSTTIPNSPLSNWMGAGIDSETRTCYKEVHVVLNPLRTPCVEDSAFRYDLEAEYSLGFVGAHGLGMRVYVYKDPGNPSDFVSVPTSVKANAFQVARSYLELQHNFSFNPVELPLPESHSLSVVIITRGTDVTRRRQTNAVAMSKAVSKNFDQARISVVDFHVDISKIDQLSVLNTADIVIAVHGGALGNILAMRPGSLLVSQCWKGKCHQWEHDMAPILGIKIEHIEYSEKFEQDDPVVNFLIPEVLERMKPYVLAGRRR